MTSCCSRQMLSHPHHPVLLQHHRVAARTRSVSSRLIEENPGRCCCCCCCCPQPASPRAATSGTGLRHSWAQASLAQAASPCALDTKQKTSRRHRRRRRRSRLVVCWRGCSVLAAARCTPRLALASQASCRRGGRCRPRSPASCTRPVTASLDHPHHHHHHPHPHPRQQRLAPSRPPLPPRGPTAPDHHRASAPVSRPASVRPLALLPPDGP